MSTNTVVQRVYCLWNAIFSRLQHIQMKSSQLIIELFIGCVNAAKKGKKTKKQENYKWDCETLIK